MNDPMQNNIPLFGRTVTASPLPINKNRPQADQVTRQGTIHDLTLYLQDTIHLSVLYLKDTMNALMQNYMFFYGMPVWKGIGQKLVWHCIYGVQ